MVGYSLLGAPLPYLLAATVMNAPADGRNGQDHLARYGVTGDTPAVEESLALARHGRTRATGSTETDAETDADTETGTASSQAADVRVDVRSVRDEESANAIDAIGARGSGRGPDRGHGRLRC